jgi:nitric oxide reductase NorD protein
MPEAEDVIVDAARHASTYAIGLWRRNRAHGPEAPSVVLSDVRQRLELYVAAVLDAHVAVRTASAPAPRTLLSRLFERGRREQPRTIVPATDGIAIYLPPRVDAASLPAMDIYRATALQQAARVMRATAQAFPWSEPLPVQDVFLIRETAAIEADVSARFPGLAAVFARVRHALLGRRPLHARGQAMAEVERVYRRYLESGRLDADCATSPAASLAWARSTASRLDFDARYPGLEPDALLGSVLQPDAVPSATAAQTDASSTPAHELRTTRVSRRPRARAASEDEDDPNDIGPWMIQTTQPHEHAEDAMGLQRPVDKEPEADLQGAGESIAELESLKLVTTPGSVREHFVGDDELGVRGARADSKPQLVPGALAYPEWDYTRKGYVERAAIVRTVATQPGPSPWVDAVLARHRATLAHVRRRFEALRSRRSVYYGQPDGDDIDLQAFVTAYGDRRARLPRTERLFVSYRPARRDFSLLLLADVSGSTEAWCGGTQRIIDLEKEALIVLATALQALRVRFAIQSFSGYGPRDVRVGGLKRFDETFDRSVAQRVAALEPDEFTRVGAALRHATASLRHEPAYRRLLLLLSDGKPNDCDRYEGRYGFEDARQALAEARLQGIAPFCVTVDHQAARHLAALFGPGNFSVVNSPQQLAAALLEWLRTVTVALA